MASVAFLGLGVMGFPMAGHLATAGHQVTVYNRTASVARRWAEQAQGSVAATPAECAGTAEVVFVCVGNDDDVRSVVLGSDGALDAMRSGSVLVDHTTASAGLAEELYRHGAERGVGFVDAPISGGQAGAENGVLTVMCGGDQDAFDTVAPIIDAYARACVLVGPSGSGQRTKMVNQLCIAGLVQGLSEAMAFGVNAGLDMAKVIDVISQGAAGSWQMDNRATTMVAGEFDFGFAVDWMRKDLGICLDEARRNGSSLPVAALVDQLYRQVQESGGGRWDTSSLIHLLPYDRS